MPDTAGDDILPYSSIELGTGKGEAFLTVMCYGIRIHVEITSEGLAGIQDGATDVKATLAYFLENLDIEPEAMTDFEDWLLRPCQTLIRQNVNLETERAELSLHSYYHPQTLAFSLIIANGRLEAKRVPDISAITKDLTPNISASESTVLHAVREGIPCIPASQLMILREPDLSDWEYFNVPGIVRQVDSVNSEHRYYFKPADTRSFFVREVDVLMRLRNLSKDLHVSKLAGLVQWDDDQSIGGLLIEEIRGAKTLDWVAEGSSNGDRTRWMAEIRHTLEQLHAANIIWEDVKPENVLVDGNGIAWVVDFGGGFTERYVDRALEGTKEGDLQGLDNIAKFLGV